MAEIRKHQPHARDDIDAAIAAALGENVRPVAPGETRARPATSEPGAAPTSPSSLGAGWAAINPAFLQPMRESGSDESSI